MWCLHSNFKQEYKNKYWFRKFVYQGYSHSMADEATKPLSYSFWGLDPLIYLGGAGRNEDLLIKFPCLRMDLWRHNSGYAKVFMPAYLSLFLLISLIHLFSALSYWTHGSGPLRAHTEASFCFFPCLEDSTGCTSARVLYNQLGTGSVWGWQMVMPGTQNTFNFMDCVKSFPPEFP